MTQSSENWRHWPRADRVKFLERLREQAVTVGSESFQRYAEDPRTLALDYWPEGFTPGLDYPLWFYDRQWEIIDSIVENKRTWVPAAHQVGKDFVAGFIALWAFISHPVARVITTSIKDDHLRVLWGELGRFLDTAITDGPCGPMLAQDGGPLKVLHREITRVGCKISYLKGMVSEKGEGMAGHHAPYTLLIVDEASGCEDLIYDRTQSWAKKVFVFGNPYPTTNFFYKGVNSPGPRDKVIRIRASDSPNVRREQALEEGEGVGEGTDTESEKVGGYSLPPYTPGVLTLEEERERRETWDAVMVAAGLDAEFYEGAEVKLIPAEWLTHAADLAREYARQGGMRVARGLGCDTGEGVADTAIVIADELGVLDLISKRTPDTSVIVNMLLEAIHRWGLASSPRRVCLDLGGGGHQIADLLRKVDEVVWDARGEGGIWKVREVRFGSGRAGYNVRTVGFGEGVQMELRRGKGSYRPLEERIETKEDRYGYGNMRAYLYGELRVRMDPNGVHGGWAIPDTGVFKGIHDELRPIPITRDGEGRLKLPPKHANTKNSSTPTLTDLIGHSPDKADALCLALYAMTEVPHRSFVTAH